MKIQRIFERTSEINFISPQKEFNIYWNSFLESELGGIYQSTPWKELSKSFKLKESRKGPQRIFSPQGMLALMFLKSYTDCSVEQKKSITAYRKLKPGQKQMRCYGYFLGFIRPMLLILPKECQSKSIRLLKTTHINIIECFN